MNVQNELIISNIEGLVGDINAVAESDYTVMENSDTTLTEFSSHSSTQEYQEIMKLIYAFNASLLVLGIREEDLRGF